MSFQVNFNKIIKNEKKFIAQIIITGRAWTDKVSDVIEKIKETGADLYVVTALDEVACEFL